MRTKQLCAPPKLEGEEPPEYVWVLFIGEFGEELLLLFREDTPSMDSFFDILRDCGRLIGVVMRLVLPGVVPSVGIVDARAIGGGSRE